MLREKKCMRSLGASSDLQILCSSCGGEREEEPLRQEVASNRPPPPSLLVPLQYMFLVATAGQSVEGKKAIESYGRTKSQKAPSPPLSAGTLALSPSLTANDPTNGS